MFAEHVEFLILTQHNLFAMTTVAVLLKVYINFHSSDFLAAQYHSYNLSSLVTVVTMTEQVQSFLFSQSFLIFPFIFSACHSCLFFPLYLFSLFITSMFPPCLIASVFSCLLAVSRKQMRTPRCALRYTWLALWTYSVYHTTTRCTEPLKHQQSVTLCCPSALACLLLLLLTHSVSHHTPD